MNSVERIEWVKMIEAAKTIAETIIWVAEERVKAGEPFQNINAAVHSVKMDVAEHLMNWMKDHKNA